MLNFINSIRVATTASLLIAAQLANAGVSAGWVNQDRQLVNSVSVGASIGNPYGKVAEFWGLSVDYSRMFSTNWSGSVSLTYDQETDRPPAQPTKIVNTFAAVLTVNYALSPRWSLTTGLSQDIMDDNNANRELRFKLGDIRTGTAVGLSLSRSLGLSFVWEWNITASEPSVSADISYRWEF